MKYALIADIHGNLPALRAVLDDAVTCGAERCLFLGDYANDLPWPNEVAELLRTLSGAVVIRGNKEDYFTRMCAQDQSGWVYEQIGALYWNYRELTEENLNYLIGLPAEAVVPADRGERIHMVHSSPIFFRKPRIAAFHSSHFLRKMHAAPFSHDEYLAYALAAAQGRGDVMGDIAALPRGVYTFGHNHMQWHARIGDKLFVNPGSCGMPLECEPGAPYTTIRAGWLRNAGSPMM